MKRPSVRLRIPHWFNGRVSALHPALYSVAVWVRRGERWVAWLLDRKKWARTHEALRLPFRIKRHRSRLMKHLDHVDPRLQHNKVHNLRIALPNLDGLLIRPGETFSFCRRVGLPARWKGYRHGLELAHGRPRPGIGGGICQLANLIHWLALHSPLTIVERSEHSVDPFPDQNRSIPFGTGAAIFYNYIDLQFRNDTEATFQLVLRIEGGDLCGELLSGEAPRESYHVFERNARMERCGEAVHRRNELWRAIIDRRTGRVLGEEFLKANDAKVLYEVPEAALKPPEVAG